jgi:predicted Zn-dependent protease
LAPCFEAFVQGMRPYEHRSEDTVLYDEGAEHLRAGRLDQALSALRASWKSRAHAGTAHRLAQTLARLGRHHESQEWAMRAYLLNPASSRFATAAAESLVEQGEIDMARKILTATLTRHRTYGPAIRLLERIK